MIDNSAFEAEITGVNYHLICDQLTSKDSDLEAVITQFGYPPLWSRPNTFESLVHIILEQQVSLASALSALNKLQERLPVLEPKEFLQLNDDELRACYLSRQKARYIRLLAQSLLNGEIDLTALEILPDAEVRRQLTALKGIGNWTADIYLIFILHRPDIFPIGDLAAVSALKKIKSLPKTMSAMEMLAATSRWQPYRSVATMILWHYYLISHTHAQPQIR